MGGWAAVGGERSRQEPAGGHAITDLIDLADLVDPDTFHIVVLIAGLAALGAAVVPRLLSESWLSFPIVYVAMGMAVFVLPMGVEPPDPRQDTELFERFAEITVIIALMGAGLKLDRRVGWRRWGATWRLLAIAMPATIAAVYLLGWWGLGLAPATAMLVAASLAPTDPVLASEVQVTGVYEGHEDDLRFALTSEAGLNDGLAFPFTNAAVLMAAAGAAPGRWLGQWLVEDVAYKLAVGLVVGLVVGKLLGDVIFTLAERGKLADASGFIALAATLLVYGMTEVVGGYGFLAVFVSAVALRHHPGSHAYHEALHRFNEEAERLLVAALLILFGGAIDAGVLGGLTWEMALVGAAVVLVVRPAAGFLALAGSPMHRRHRIGTAFFGIRGMGSIYYLAHGLALASFAASAAAWALVAWVILLSIMLHGLTSTPFVRWVEREPG